MRSIRTVVSVLALAAPAASAQIFFDDFDSYKAGSGIAGQGGWEVWCTGGLDGAVSDAHARSEPNSLRITPGSDIVQRFNETSGQLVFSFSVYVPSGASGGSGSINLMNTYCAGPQQEMQWSTSTTFNPDTGLVAAWSGETLPLIKDQWAEHRTEIDLDADRFSEFYAGQLLVNNRPWSTNVFGGVPEFRAADFYSDSLSEIFFDDVRLERAAPGCYPDFTGDGELDLFDFLQYVNEFNAQTDRADCTEDGVYDLFDFLCFVNAFNEGC